MTELIKKEKLELIRKELERRNYNEDDITVLMHSTTIHEYNNLKLPDSFKESKVIYNKHRNNHLVEKVLGTNEPYHMYITLNKEADKVLKGIINEVDKKLKNKSKVKP